MTDSKSEQKSDQPDIPYEEETVDDLEVEEGGTDKDPYDENPVQDPNAERGSTSGSPEAS